MNGLFKNVGGANPARSMFNLSYQKLLTCDMGELIPVLCDEALPGDIWKIGMAMVLRFTPLVAPIMHEVDVYYHVFFVPNRVMCRHTPEFDWESFITGGVDGDDVQTPPYLNSPPYSKGGLIDYLGMPTGVTWPINDSPVAFPMLAYGCIWEDYYRDETLEDLLPDWPWGDTLFHRNWEKDRYTSALLEQQRGTAPAVPLVGSSSAVWDQATFPTAAGGVTLGASSTAGQPIIPVNNANAAVNVRDAFNDNTIAGTGLGFDLNDLRLATQIQRFMERNERAGVRYTEFIDSHYGRVAPRDERLQRPEYIGGCKFPVIVSEVLQTSMTSTTPQGTMTGHGMAINQDYIAKYHVREHGIIMGILSIMPKPVYNSQGLDKQWIKATRYDYYFPEFAHLSEQAIEIKELYLTNNEVNNNTVFGYCGAYDEYRVKHNIVAGNFRDTYDYWHISRQFGSQPALNDTFINCIPRKDVFAVQNEDCCLVSFGNLLNVLRPMPIIAEPGFVDHG